MKNYCISNKTLLVVPKGKSKSTIIEKLKNYDVDNNTLQVMEDSCSYFGSNYYTRLHNTYQVMKSKYKVPIIVEEKNNIVFFPTNSPNNPNNVWICYNNVKEYLPYLNGKQVKVRFNNSFELILDVSYYSFNQQFLKSAKLHSKINQRRKKTF